MQMPGVKEIIMINSYEQVKVEVGVKQENGSWQIITFTSLEDKISLSAFNEQISLCDIYEGVSFD
jgi:16S rRNA C1402 N4-methylase RsmH